MSSRWLGQEFEVMKNILHLILSPMPKPFSAFLDAEDSFLTEAEVDRI